MLATSCRCALPPVRSAFFLCKIGHACQEGAHAALSRGHRDYEYSLRRAQGGNAAVSRPAMTIARDEARIADLSTIQQHCTTMYILRL